MRRSATLPQADVRGMTRLAIHALASLICMCGSCGGPQPLRVAIDPRDESEYLKRLNAAAGDGRAAYVAWMAEERQAPEAAILAADGQLSSTRNPFDAHEDVQAVSRGAVIYKMHCARCHGTDAQGRGPSTLPEYPAPDFHSFAKRFAATLHRGAPRKWFRVIRDGDGDPVDYPDGRTSAMPSFSDSLTREQIWLVITYLQSLDMHAKGADDKADQG